MLRAASADPAPADPASADPRRSARETAPPRCRVPRASRYAGGVSDQRLISRFYPAMTEGFPVPAGPEETVELHAELLHRICVADGLLEVLEWTLDGTPADPSACMWLAGLRWYRLVSGSYPETAPQPPQRQTDAALSRLLDTGAVQVMPATGGVSLAGLASGELHHPSAPAQPQVQDRDALLRLTPLALVPYIDEPMRMRWLEQNLATTHGSTDLLEEARGLVSGLRERAGAESPAPGFAEATTTASAAATGAGHPLYQLLRNLAERWESVTAPG